MKNANQNISDFFGVSTFDLGQLRSRLPQAAFRDLEKKATDPKRKISKETLESIAQVIKEWALSKGATHFCHWFQPLNGHTAEKHDAFIHLQTFDQGSSKVIERFTGNQLIQGEPDASSFPSGGVRTTFEARGYTTWDHTSPIFLLENKRSKTLCIPSHFVGYDGQALDNKTPLVRSLRVLSDSACQFLKLLGDVDAKHVTSTLGVEQEYFLVDAGIASSRPDLVLADRTLFGQDTCRGQKLEDHYFGAIPTKALEFMEDLEFELYKLGIPVKTRHNEVAPSQFEMAPIFENANIAADHNSLSMEVMKRTASRHGLVCLLHEKPFMGVNGSGKHCNWSLSNEKGENLLEPGRTPHQNLRFLAILVCVVRAVHRHGPVLMAMASSHGNDQRLGENEAPSNILSVYLGDLVESILSNIGSDSSGNPARKPKDLNLGVNQLSGLSQDYADRNRTSSFAFTGNKFEFRTIGASASVALPMATLNTAVAQSFNEASELLKDLTSKYKKRDEAIIELIREFYTQSKAVIYSGNCYANEWVSEAKQRGLFVANNANHLATLLTDESSISFLTNNAVFTKEELIARKNLEIERYAKKDSVELQTLIRLGLRFALPSLEKQLFNTQNIISGLQSKSVKKHAESRLMQMEESYSQCCTLISKAQGFQEEYAQLDSLSAKELIGYSDKARELKSKFRRSLDQMEEMVASEFWNLPTYHDLLFSFKYDSRSNELS